MYFNSKSHLILFLKIQFTLIVFAASSNAYSKAIPALHKTIEASGYPDTLAVGCSPISTLSCSALKVDLPYSLSFNAAVAGTITDKNGVGTGFTTVNTYSGTRLTADGQPTNTQVPGYEPSKITVTGGRLQLVANKGIDFLTNNNQLNVLGVKIKPTRKVQLEVKLINPVNKTASQQGGLWYGRNDKTYIKLGVTGNKVELRKEINDVTSVTAGPSNPDQRITAVISNLNTKTVQLRMVIDSMAGTVAGYYSIDGGITFINAGMTYALPELSVTGMALTDSVAYGGIFATYRNGSNPDTYNFDDFGISSLTTPTVLQTVQIDFLPKTTTAPDGFLADVGLAFNVNRKYGWLNTATQQPSDYSANMRLRSGTTDAKQRSLVQMQSTTDNKAPGSWEYTVPNGLYTVTVSAGDNNYYDSNHQINVEGLPAVSDFTPSSSNKFRVATATVQVNDGRLTIDATGGTNTKMNYLIFAPAKSVTDVTTPTASARFVGTLKSARVYDKQVQVYITGKDEGGSGLTKLQYTLNGSTYTNYTAPFVINTPGSYSMAVRAVDANNNETVTNVYYFSVYDETAYQAVNIDFLPEGAPLAVGFTPDYGNPFASSRKFGWLSAYSGNPSDYRANMRLRSDTTYVKQRTLVEMQSNTDNEQPGVWEHIVPNGLYTVIVGAGDSDYLDSDHQINVEGLPVVSDFIPSADEKYRVGTATVQVNDGRLTINATGGVKTKMTYLSFSLASTVADTVAPVTNARFEGSVYATDVYNDQVKIFITAADEGGSGLAILQYAINDGAYINYTVPFAIQTPGDYNLKIKAVDANGNQKIVSAYNFTVIDPNAPKILSFSKERISFTILKGQTILPQTVNLTTSPTTNSYIFAKTEASWLTLPAKSRTLQFGPDNINSNMPVGDYQALVTCTADNYQTATLLIDLHVIEDSKPQVSDVNFQDAATVPPLGYVRDYGQAYGVRTGQYQGAGLEYGWRKRSDGTVVNLTANGRNRNTPEDILLATLFHMQADDIPGTFAGTKTEAYWEMKVLNGTYDVTVAVGDGLVNTSPELHSINIEGVNVINQFIPNGKKGTNSRFKYVTSRINVTDEYLTINADGGTNTKICSVNILPVSLAPYLFWASKTTNVLIKKGSAENSSFSIVLGSSTSSASGYTLTANYGSGATGWLSFNPSPTGLQANVSFDFSAAKNLAIGIYKATIKATSAGFTSAAFDIQINVVDGSKPYVISSSPANGSTKVALSTVSIAANNLHIPIVEGFKGGVNNSTIDSSTVKLLKIVNGTSTKVAGVVQGTGGGDVISFSPSSGLEANTVYKFVITSGVQSYTGAGFSPYEATFTTAAAKIDSSNILNAHFTKVPIPGTQNQKYTSLTVGPDGRFYALRLDGAIERYNINHADGMLSSKFTISTLVNKYGNRSAVGLVFDPLSTASNLIAWVSHSSEGLASAPTFDGNISRLQGDNLQNEQLAVTKLPRSKRDHLVNSLAFGPDSALYICQGSMSSAGSYDGDWQREEVLLSGAVLRLDLVKLSGFNLPLNVQTTSNQNLINNAPSISVTMSDSTYNPYGSSSPLTIYASGVRNPYDLVWHSNGQLYLPTNGSGGGGNSPASVTGTRRPNGTFYNGTEVTATTGIAVQHDWLFRVNPAMPVGYFGHPNPLRGEYVLNRGFMDNNKYFPSVGTDVNYRPAAYDFGLNNSPNGALEYKSNTFGGILKGKLLVCRFAGGGDIAVMEPGSKVKTSYSGNDDSIYDIVKVTTGSGNNGLVGMSGFGNPLDIVEDVVNGNLYIVEYNWNDSPNLISQITLLKAQTGPAPAVRTAASYEPVSNEVQAKNKKYDITVSNKGGDVLRVKSIRITGPDAAKFRITDVNLPTEKSPLRIRKNSPVTFKVYAKAAAPEFACYAKLLITSMDNSVTEVDINNALESDIIEFENIQAEINDDGLMDHSLEVYPNPNDGRPLSVQLKRFNSQEKVSIYLYDKTGNMIKFIKGVTNEKGEFTTGIPLNGIVKSGFYIVRVEYLSGFRVAKIINID